MDYKDVKKIALNVADDIKDTSVRLYKTTKLSIDISKRKNELDDKFKEIGKTVYKIHCNSEADDSRIGEICEEIDNILLSIKELEETKSVLKANKKCDVCGCVIHPEATECPNCGCDVNNAE